MSDALTQRPLAAIGPAAGLPISVVATRTGDPQATLRAWQHRYGLGPSRRTEGGTSPATAPPTSSGSPPCGT